MPTLLSSSALLGLVRVTTTTGEEGDDMAEDLYSQLEPVVTALGLELFDVEVRPGYVVVLVDRPGGVDLDALADANRVVSAHFDAHDPVPGRYTLEVSSPGVERPLRRPEHFGRAVGETVQVKTKAGTDGVRRTTGVLVAADETGFTVAEPGAPGGEPVERRFAYVDVDRVRTVFSWGPGPKPGAAAGRRPTPTPERKQVTTR